MTPSIAAFFLPIAICGHAETWLAVHYEAGGGKIPAHETTGVL
jgi:hypothetical protein